MSEPLLDSDGENSGLDEQVGEPTPRRLTWEDSKSGSTPARHDSSNTDDDETEDNYRIHYRQPKLKSVIVRPSTPTSTANHRRRPKLRALDPRRYNGKSPIDEYLAQFEVIARHNQWDKYEQAAALLSALDGTACSIINELDDVASATYVTVREALIRRFGATKRTDVHERALDDIKMKKDDDIKQTAQEIVKLTRRAYPELTASQRERFAIKALISAIDDSDTAFYIKDKEPATINDVCDLYEKYETLCRGHRRRRPANVNKCQSPTRHSSSTEQAEQPDNVEKWMKETNGKIQPPCQRNHVLNVADHTGHVSVQVTATSRDQPQPAMDVVEKVTNGVNVRRETPPDRRRRQTVGPRPCKASNGAFSSTYKGDTSACSSRRSTL